MDDYSGDAPIGRWANSGPDALARRCTAHKKNGDRCGNPSRRGTTVCDFHGAKAPQVKAKARQRLEEAATKMAERVLGLALSDDIPPAVALAAAKDALDRAGLKPPTQVEVGLGAGPSPFEQMIAGVGTMTRAESRAARGIPDDTPRWVPPALPPGEILEAEVVEAPDLARDATFPGARGNPPDDAAQPGTGLMSLAEANEALRDSQRRYNEGY